MSVLPSSRILTALLAGALVGGPTAARSQGPARASEGPEASPEASPEALGERPRLLVLDLITRGTPEKLVERIAGEVAGALRDAGTDQVVSQDDVRPLSGGGAQGQPMGCEEESCLTEIAGALGAQQIVTGQTVHLGRVTQVRLKRIDAASARVLRDTAVGSASADELLELVRRAAFDLIDAPWTPRSTRQVAWAELTLEVGASLRGVAYGQQTPDPTDSGGDPESNLQSGPVLVL